MIKGSRREQEQNQMRAAAALIEHRVKNKKKNIAEAAAGMT